MNKIPSASQNTEAKTLPTDVCIFDRFGRLSPATVHSADCWFDTGVKCWIYVSSIVTYLRKNFFLLDWNRCKQCSESSMRCCFWSTVSKRGTYFEHSFLIDKFLYKIHGLLISSTPLLSPATSIYDQPKWFFSVFDVFLNKSAYHLLTVVSNGEEFEYHLSSPCFAWTVFFPPDFCIV